MYVNFLDSQEREWQFMGIKGRLPTPPTPPIYLVAGVFLSYKCYAQIWKVPQKPTKGLSPV